MTLKKSTKRFLLSSESLNDRGFRVRTEGIDLEGFRKNPVLLWAHQEPKGESREEILPLGIWEDIEVIDGKVYATPAFDTSDPFALSIYNKVENGTIRMASAGLIAREWSEINGEKWLWTSAMAEGSILTRGSNPEALSSVALFTEDKELITLSSEYFDTILNKDMPDKLNLSAEQLGIIGLSADAKPEEVAANWPKVIQLVSTQKAEIAALSEDKQNLSAKVTTLTTEKAELDTKVKTLEEQQVKAYLKLCAVQGKITEGEIPKYTVLLQSSDANVVKTTKEELEAMDSHEPLHKAPSTEEKTELQTLSAMSFKELDKAGKAVRLKALDMEVFNQKFKEEFGKDHPEYQK